MRKFLAPLALASIMFGCSDNSVDLGDYRRDSIVSMEDLQAKKCNSNNDGETVVYNGENQSGSRVYTCMSGVWIGNMSDSVKYEKPVSSSSHKTISSSSTKTSSSSSKKISSSSSASKVDHTPIVIDWSSSSVSDDDSPTSPTPVIIPSDVFGTCAATNGTTAVAKGEPVAFKFVLDKALFPVLSISDIGATTFEWNYGSGTPDGTENKATSSKVTFAESGDPIVAVTVSVPGMDPKTVSCPIHVNGDPITGCTCEAAAGSVDFTQAGASASWTVSGCQSASDQFTYEWTGVTGNGASASYTFAKAESVTPKLVVHNNDNSILDVACPAVKGTEGAEYLINKEEVEVEVPIGACIDVGVSGYLHCGHDYQNEACFIAIDYDGLSVIQVDNENCHNVSGVGVAVVAGSLACLFGTGVESAICQITDWGP